MRYILLLLMLFLPQPLPATQPIAIVFVEPPGEALTASEMASGMAAVHGAAAYWNRALPTRAALVVSTDVLTITPVEVLAGDTYAVLTWSIPYLRTDGATTVFLIDNSESQMLLGGRAVGVAMEEWKAAYVVMSGLRGADGLAAATSHELGHAVEHLPDIVPFGTARDIMSDPVWAYAHGVVGAQSLCTLGICPRMVMPLWRSDA